MTQKCLDFQQYLWYSFGMNDQMTDDELRVAGLARMDAARAASSTSPIVRKKDGANAHLAASLIQPKRGTRKGNVLGYLRVRGGEWVPGHELCTPDVGGSEGLRRLRELEDGGLVVDKRPSGDGRTSWDYRVMLDD